VVLIIALVSIALLGFFPGMATDTRIAQSAAYWNSAYPFAIKSHMMNAAAASGKLVVQNMDSTGSNQVTALSVGGSAATVTGSPVAFAPGETKTLAITAGIPTCGASGATYDYQVVFTYTNAAGISGFKQNGTKTLTGKCS